MTSKQISNGTPEVSRREALRIGLAAAALAVVAGAGSARASAKDVAKANDRLTKTLVGLTDDEVRQGHLATIALRIGWRSRELVEEHEMFRARFDTVSRARERSVADLEKVLQDFEGRRVAQRDEMLRLQDELRADLSDEEWTQVVGVLADGQVPEPGQEA